MGTDNDADWAVETEVQPDQTVLRVTGDLDLETAPRLLADAEPILAAAEGALLVDLSRLAFIDSSGLSTLIRINQRMTAAGRKLAIVPPPPLVAKVFEITGLHEVLPLVRP